MSLAVPVVVVDDHRMVVLGLRTLFHNRPEVEVVAWAHDADEGMEPAAGTARAWSCSTSRSGARTSTVSS